MGETCCDMREREHIVAFSMIVMNEISHLIECYNQILYVGGFSN